MTNWHKIGIPVLIGSIFFISSLLLLTHGHLSEDAYILFQYSKKLATGQGIVFDEVSGHTEGATDFLWMLILSVMHRSGLDLGTSAAILNAIGLSLTAYVILKLNNNLNIRATCGLLLILFSGGFAAALGGFSTLAYGGLYSFYTFCILQRKYKWISALSIIISLFRPDGLILALGGIMATLFFATKYERKKFILILLPSLLIGIFYFIWRWQYFESILPLPLQVKVKTDKLFEGVYTNLAAMRWHWLLVIPFFILLKLKDFNKIIWRDYFAIGLGPLLLFIALSFAHQSQNVGYRFQYPIILSLIFIYIISLNKIDKPNKILLTFPIIGVMFGATIIYHDVKNLTNGDYINALPQLLRQSSFICKKIAITEAGRFPFWYDTSEMIDLVGLNSRSVVSKGAEEVLNSSKPDLIFVHHADRFDINEFDSSKSFQIKNASAIKIKNQYLGRNPVLIAPESALKFAIQNNYHAIAVQYGEENSNFNHFYFISPKLNKELFIDVLIKSHQNKISYYQSLHFELTPTNLGENYENVSCYR